MELKRIVFSLVVSLGLCGTVAAQTFTFECIGGFLTNADANCDICTGQTTSRLFNGLYIKQNGVKWRWIDCPYIVRQQGSNLVFQELINPNPETVTINLLASGFSTIAGFKDSTACMCARQDSAWINGVDTTHFVNASNATSHTLSLTPSPAGGSIQLIEGANVTLTTGGTALAGTVTIAATSGGGTDLTYTGVSSPVTLNSSTGTDVTVTAGTGVSLTATGTDLTINNTGDLSATNEAWTVDADDADTELITTQTVKFGGGGIVVTDYIPGTDILTITGTEVDGSVSNEGILGVSAGGANDANLTTSTSLGNPVNFAGAGIVTISESTSVNGGTITITGTEVDGSTSNELQTLANTSDATSHTVTLSNSGGSVQIAEGTGVGIATTGTGLNGIATITNTAPDQTVSITGAGISVVTGTYPTFTVTSTEVDGSVTNEAWTVDADAGDTEVISNQTLLVAGGGIISTSYTAAGNTLTVTGTEVDGSVTNEIQTITGSGSGTTYALDLSLSGGSIGLIEGTNITIDRTGNDFTFNSTATGGTNYQTFLDDGTPMTQQPNANFESTSDIAWTLVNDAGNTETEINADIPANAVDYAEIQQVAASRILGNPTGSPADVSEISLASGLSFVGTALTPADASATNEAWTIDADAGDAEVISSQTVLFEGAGGIATDYDAATNTLTVDGSAISGGSFYQTVRDDGADETQRAALNFVSTSTVNAVGTDDAGNNETEISFNVPTDGITATEIAAGAVGTSEIATNAVANADFRQGVARSVVGVTGNATADVADIQGTADQVLRVNSAGTALDFGQVNLASTNAVTGTLPVGNGGTGAATFTNNRLLTGNGTSAIVDEANATFDGTTLAITGKQSIAMGGSFSTSQNMFNVTGSVTSTANSLSHNIFNFAPVFANDGTLTGQTYVGMRVNQSTATPTAGISQAINVYNTNTSENVTQLYGLYSRVDENSTSGSLGTRIAGRFDMNKTSDAFDSHNGTAVLARVAENSASGRWSSAVGLEANVSSAITGYGIQSSISSSKGTGNTQYGMLVTNTASGSGVVVSNAYGTRYVPVESSSGSITTYYSIFNNTAPVATTSYFLYNSQDYRNYFNGNLALGVDVTTAKLFVRGTGSTSSTIAFQLEKQDGTDYLVAKDDGKVGIGNNSTIARELHVTGEVRITDLTTDTPTRIVGADADGDLDTVGIGAENELHLTAGTLGTNFHTTISPAALTTATNNWNPTGLSTAWIVRLSGNGTFVMLTGITAPSFNKRLIIANVGSTDCVLLPTEMTSSTAGNRFSFGRDIVLFPGKSIEIQYDVTSARWLLLSKAGLYDDVEHLYSNQVFTTPVSITSADYDFWDIGSEAAAVLSAPTSGRRSAVTVNTGTSAAGLGYVSSKNDFFQTDNSSGTATWAYCKAVIRTPATLSDGTDDYTIRVGFNMQTGGGGGTDGLYFDYNHANVSGNWGCNTTNGGNTQRNNSGIAVTTSTVYVLEVVVRPSLLVEYFINGTRVATNDTYVSTGDDMFVLAEIEKSIGATQRSIDIFTLQTSTATVR